MLVLNACPNDTQTSRFGFTVSKRLGNAVERNRIRRRLRSAVVSTDIKCGWDLVLIARNRARNANYHVLRRSLNRLLLRANLTERNSERQFN
jgi:ribonuclease P protein component